jgi:hypothetical protein
MAQGSDSQQSMQALRASPLMDLGQDVASRLFVSQSVFADFARRTIQQMGSAPTEALAKSLQCSLGLAESQLLETVGHITTLVGKAVADGDVGLIIPESSLVVPFEQQAEIVAAGVEEDDEFASALMSSDAARMCRRAIRVLLLVTQCNEAARIALGHEVFKPTNRIMESCTCLPWTMAKDKTTLGNVVDYLFWTLYEGAGDDKLRFHVDAKGPLVDAECDAVFWIKYLRNKWLRHDPDHGKDAKIEKSWKDVGEALSGLGLGHLPVTEEEFRFIQRRLLEEAEAFLTLLLNRLTTH